MKAHISFSTKLVRWAFAMSLFCAAAISGCSSDPDQTAGVGTGGTGSVALDVIDAPSIDYDHVYVTVTGIAFHTDTAAVISDNSDSKAAGWQIITLAAPKTVDLAELTNGKMYADINNGSSLFSGIKLPVGSYKQIRIFLASTEDQYSGSVTGLEYNNEVQLSGDPGHYPLRIPSPDEGIKVLPESPVTVVENGNVRLALDFNLSDDIVKISPNGSTEFMYKPRLGYFDLGSAGAVKGAVTTIFSNFSSSRIEVKAEQINNGGKYRIVRRMTSIDKATGEFKLYPLPVFGNATTATYDILLRGRNVQTAIIKGVKVHKGTTLTNGATELGTIAMHIGGEFSAQLAAPMHPTGSWVNFYQTIAGDSVPYEVRYRHLNPYTGTFDKEELSTGVVWVASYNAGNPLTFTTDTTSQGVFSAVADAANFYDRGAQLLGIKGTAGTTVPIEMATKNYPQITNNSTAKTGSISCVFDMTLLGTGTGAGMGMGNRNIGLPTKGQIFITHGGMIIDSIGELTGSTAVNTSMSSGGGTTHSVSITNLPGNIPSALYGVYVLGWGNGYIVAGKKLGIDMRQGVSATATIKLK